MSFISTYSDSYQLVGGLKYVRTTRFAQISSGTSGSVTLPSDAQVVLDDFGGTTDAIVSAMEGGKPNFQAVTDAGGNLIATTFDVNGDWVLSGTPTSYPVAIIYRVQQQHKNFDSASADILGSTEVADTRNTIFNKQDKITGAASTVTTANLTPDRVTISNSSGKLANSGFLSVNEALDKKELLAGTDQTISFGDGRLGPVDTGSEIQYGSGYAYAADSQIHAVEVYAYNIINGQKYVWPNELAYIELEADSSEDYQLLWQWDTNYAADGFFVLKYDDTYSGDYYADVSTNSLLENFTDWSTQTAYTGFNYNPPQIEYDSSYVYPADSQYHAIEVYPYRIVQGIKLYDPTLQYYELEADNSDNYQIQWSWFAVPNVDGYVVAKYDDTWSGEYCVDVTTNTFTEDFTDWSTKTATPALPSSVEESQYILTGFSGIKSVKNNVEKLLIDQNGLYLSPFTSNKIPTIVNNRIVESNYTLSGGTLQSDTNFSLQAGGVSANCTFRSGFSQTGTGVSSGNFLLETRNASTKTNGGNPPPSENGRLDIKTGNGASNTSVSSYTTAGGAGQIEFRGGVGGNAQNGTNNNQAGSGGRINIVAGNGGNATGPGGSGGPGAAYQMQSGAGGNCISSGPGQSGNAGNGGVFFCYANNGGQLNGVSGKTGDAGDMNFQTGFTYPSLVAGSVANTGGRGGNITFTASAGGNAANSLVANTGGRAGDISFIINKGGDADTTQGRAGSISFSIAKPGANSAGTSQGTVGNITFSPSPAAIVGGAEGSVILAPTHGQVGIATTAPTHKLDIDANTIRLRQNRTITNANDSGVIGEICWDADYVYVCVAANTWKRAAIGTW